MTTIASTSRTWMNPPMVYEKASPRAHRTTRTIAIVRSMTRNSGFRCAANRDFTTVYALTAVFCPASYTGAHRLCSLAHRTSRPYAAQSDVAHLLTLSSGRKPTGSPKSPSSQGVCSGKVQTSPAAARNRGSGFFMPASPAWDSEQTAIRSSSILLCTRLSRLDHFASGIHHETAIIRR